MKTLIAVFSITVFCLYLSGCVFLAVAPICGITAHVIQRSNKDYDNIIINFGYRYKQYYLQMQENNKYNETQQEILTFEQWIETQAKTEKEQKAITRYKKIAQ